MLKKIPKKYLILLSFRHPNKITNYSKLTNERSVTDSGDGLSAYIKWLHIET